MLPERREILIGNRTQTFRISHEPSIFDECTMRTAASYPYYRNYLMYLLPYCIVLQFFPDSFQLSPDGNVSTTTVIFIPTESDAGKFLSCRAENMQLPDGAVEDQWKIEVHCE